MDCLQSKCYNPVFVFYIAFGIISLYPAKTFCMSSHFSFFWHPPPLSSPPVGHSVHRKFAQQTGHNAKHISDNNYGNATLESIQVNCIIEALDERLSPLFAPIFPFLPFANLCRIGETMHQTMHLIYLQDFPSCFP